MFTKSHTHAPTHKTPQVEKGTSMQHPLKADLDTLLSLAAITCHGANAYSECLDQCQDPIRFTDETGKVAYKCDSGNGWKIELEVKILFFGRGGPLSKKGRLMMTFGSRLALSATH
jgi:hypothetical protein